MGIVSCIGSELDKAWRNILEGNSGITPIEAFDASGFSTRIGGAVTDFDVSEVLPPKDARKMDPFMHYGIAASDQALADSGIEVTEANGQRIGIAMGAGIGGLATIETNHQKLINGGPRKISPFFIPGSIINMISGHVSIMHGITGPNLSIVTACTTSTHCIGISARIDEKR
jgi:3-oxoacyl-[acyl-carrier-protein] synthase II